MCKHNVTLCAEVDVLTNSLQSQIMQCSEKLQNVISRTLQALVNVLNVKGKVLVCVLFGRIAKKTSSMSNKSMTARLRFVMLYLNKPQNIWSNVLWTDGTKMEIFGNNAQHHIWRKPNTLY